MIALFSLMITALNDYFGGQSFPLVETPFGKIEGNSSTIGNVTVDLFLGIRYAQPPTGARRLLKSEMIKPWTNVIEAKTWGYSCYSFNQLMHNPFATYSEDCLFLNIIRPSNKVSYKLPVLIFIHGGGFTGGDATNIGYTAGSQNFVSQDIIFVTLQYRLGPLGFLSTDDGLVKGNNGLWDQTLALQFLRQILPSFGGDINRITIAGQSAGSASVSALLYSPHSQHLFQHGIQMSGSSFAEWSMSHNLVKKSARLAQKFGCAKTHPIARLQCLQQINPQDLVKFVWNHEEFAEWGPHEDGHFFPKSILELVDKAPPKNTIQGRNSAEATGFCLTGGAGAAYVVLEESWKSFNFVDLAQRVDISLLSRYDLGSKNATLRQLVMDYYVLLNGAGYYYLKQYVNMLNDLLFVVPNAQELVAKSKNGWPTWYYINDYTSPVLNSFGLQPTTYPIEGAVHGMEERAIFGMDPLEGLPLSQDDVIFKNNFVEAFVAFVKTGNPSTSRLAWQPTSSGHPFRHLCFNTAPYIDDEMMPKAYNFWNRVVPTRIGLQLLRDTLSLERLSVSKKENSKKRKPKRKHGREALFN